MAIYVYNFGSDDTAPGRIIFDTDTNLYTVQWYNTTAAAYEDVLQMNGNTKEITEIALESIGAILIALYADGSDEAITEPGSGEIHRQGALYTTSYNDNGRVVTVDGACLAIFATEMITIAGTIDASGKGGAGGPGGTGGSNGADGNDGSAGGAGSLVGATGTGGTAGATSAGAGGDGGAGAGGGGGATDGKAGGAGADGVAPDNPRHAHRYPSPSYHNLIDLLIKCGSGGSGGGGGAGQASGDTGGDGGAGGAGGGNVILCAPEIRISGTINVAGLAGAGGEDGNSSGTNAGGGGGGAGGNAGVILIITPKLTEEDTTTYTTDGGAGGTGGALKGTAGAGGDGGDGSAGLTVKLVLG